MNNGLRIFALLFVTVILLVCISPALAWDQEMYNEGIDLINEHKYPEAIAYFTEYIKYNPEDPWGLFYRGDTYRRYKRFRLALIDFNRAIKLAPTFVHAHKGSELARRAVTDAPKMERPDRVFEEVIRVMPLSREPVVPPVKENN